jgi:hypothetical protein
VSVIHPPTADRDPSATPGPIALSTQALKAIALEDSPNGILAAKRAGLFCVAIPNDLTRQLSLSLADCQLDSLADLPLAQLLQRAIDLQGTRMHRTIPLNPPEEGGL